MSTDFKAFKKERINTIFKLSKVEGLFLDTIELYEERKLIIVLHLFEEKKKFNKLKQGFTNYLEKPLTQLWRQTLIPYRSDNVFTKFDYVLIKKRRLKNSNEKEEFLFVEFKETKINHKKKQFLIHLGKIV